MKCHSAFPINQPGRELSIQPVVASTRIMASAPMCQREAEMPLPKRFPVRRSNKAQKEVVKPAIARWEWATSALVNFRWSRTPGRKVAKPLATSSAHQKKTIMPQVRDLSGQTKARQSRTISQGQGSKSPKALIWRRSRWVPPRHSAHAKTAMERPRRTRAGHAMVPFSRLSPKERGRIISSATTTSVEPSKLAPVGPPVVRSTGG